MKSILLAVFLFITASTQLIAQWTKCGGLYGADVRSFASLGNTIFACTGVGVIRSSDNGDNWNVVLRGPTQSIVIKDSAITIFIDSPQRSSNPNVCYRSTDLGTTWVNVATDSVFKGVKKLFYHQGVLFAIAWLVFPDDYFLYKSTDDGITWKRVQPRVKNALFEDNMLTVAVTDSLMYACCASTGLFKSADGGESWEQVNGNSSRVLTLFIKDSIFYAGAVRGAVLKSTNYGAEWTVLETGTVDMGDVSSFVYHDSTFYMTTKAGGVYRSKYNDTSWVRVNEGLSYTNINTLFLYGTSMFAGTASGGVFRSNEKANSWSMVNDGIISYRITKLLTWDSALYATAFGGGLFMSNDNGQSWTTKNNGMSTLYLNSLAGNDSTIIVKTFNWRDLRDGIDMSSDKGKSWSWQPSYLTNFLGSVHDLFGHKSKFYTNTEGLHVMFGTSPWMKQTLFFDTLSINTFASLDTTVYVGTYRGIYQSSAKDGRTWTEAFSEFKDSTDLHACY